MRPNGSIQRAGLPVEITAEFEIWRRVRDSEGVEGWVLHSLLSGRRTALVTPSKKGENSKIYARAERGIADLAATLQSGVIVNMRNCDGAWCLVDGDGFKGYIQQVKLWGVYPEREDRMRRNQPSKPRQPDACSRVRTEDWAVRRAACASTRFSDCAGSPSPDRRRRSSSALSASACASRSWPASASWRASAALNLALRWRFPVSTQLSERGATIMLGYDILQFAGLLFLTGGVANPFVHLFLAPVTIAATSLTFRQALGLLGLALVCATALLRASLPMPWLGGENLTLPPLYVVGLWAASRSSAAFRGVLRLSRRRGGPPDRERARPRPSSCSRAPIISPRSTGWPPLRRTNSGRRSRPSRSSCAEWADQPPAVKGFADDLRLLEQSVDKCRTILGKLSEPAGADRPARWTSRARWNSPRSPPPRTGCSASPSPSKARARPAAAMPAQSRGPLRPRQPDRERRRLRREGGRDPRGLEQIDGQDRHRRRRAAAFRPAFWPRIGEPYLSQRDGARRIGGAGGGLGLGLFIARSLLERSARDARIRQRRRRPPAARSSTVAMDARGLRAGSTGGRYSL